MCNWVTLLYSRKLTEHCKLAIMEKIKIIMKKRSLQTINAGEGAEKRNSWTWRTDLWWPRGGGGGGIGNLGLIDENYCLWKG